MLDRALERPRPVDRVESGARQQVDGRRRDIQPQVALAQATAQQLELHLRDAVDLLGTERVEHHRVVDAVDELRAEVASHHVHHRRLHARIIRLGGHFLDQVRAQV